jgi:predicted MFS family arabinose efflux permease
MVAYVVFAPVLGALAQRLPRRRLLISMDLLRAGIVLAFPLAEQVWQIYLLIFLLNVCSAGFKPVFSATIPDVLPDEAQYTRALSMSRVAYDLESLLSPLIAGLALLLVSYSGLFVANAAAFGVSALLILATPLPASRPAGATGGLVRQIGFGLMAYLQTPRLRALLALYLAVASASAMVIVNTVVYVRQTLGRTESDVAMALAAAGAGSMIVAMGLPALLNRFTDRAVMLGGSMVLVIGLGGIGTGPDFGAMLPVWFVVGAGLSMVQTPAGRLVNRSAAPADRPAYFSAQFALSHVCWLLFYPLAGQLATGIGIEATARVMAAGAGVFTIAAALLWPSETTEPMPHVHEEALHDHEHVHDEHHDHDHEGWEGDQPHRHAHRHPRIQHAHTFVIDDHHTAWPRP